MPKIDNDPVIQLRDLHLSLSSGAGEVNILRGIDMSVASGESVGVVGPSGAGKSTLLMVLAGLEQADSGEVTVAGNDLRRLDEDRLALFRRDHVGIVFQSFRLVPTMTALENVAIPLEFAGVANAFERAEACLGKVGLDHRISHYPDQLSGGEQQRVAIARAFVGEPDLLLADEPTGNLDGETGQQIIDLLFSLQSDQDHTLLLVTHDEALASRCDRTVRVTDGQISGGLADG